METQILLRPNCPPTQSQAELREATMSRSLASVPAAFFGIVLGIAGMGNAWLQSSRVWSLPVSIGHALGLLALAVWGLLPLLYIHKWISAREQALDELRHPVQCCFVGLWPVSAALVALPLKNLTPTGAWILAVTAVIGQLAFGVFRTGALWKGGRDPVATTPVLYLPTVAGSFVSTIVLSAFGHSSSAKLFFGIGMFSWLAIESVLLQRLYVIRELSPALRPTLGILLAPPAVACVAYEAISDGPPDLFTQALIGYAVFQLLILARLIFWIREQRFTASYWSFTFGLSALPAAMLRYVDRGGAGVIQDLAPIVFFVSNIIVAGIAFGTLYQLIRGKLLPTVTATPEPLR